MKTIGALRNVLKVSIFFMVSSLLIGFSIINPLQYVYSFYFPFMPNLDPSDAEMNNALVISEIMINPVGAEPGKEWIEIFNRSPNGIDLYGYKIGDSEERGDLEGMYTFPVSSKIPPGETVVIANQAVLFAISFGVQPDFELSDSDPEIPNLLKYRNWAGGVINLRNGGDEILILNPKDKQVDAVSWGDSNYAFNPPAPIPEDGMSLERNPANVDSNRADDWIIRADPDPGSASLEGPTSVPSTPTMTQPNCDNIPVLISEVLYDPAIVEEPGGEWVEIYNYGDLKANLDCLMLGDEETIGGSEGMMVFPSGNTVSPGKAIVIANQGDIFSNHYGFFPDFEIRETLASVPNLIDYPQWASGSIRLSNSGDELLLINLSGNQLDAVSWKDSVYAFDPPVAGVNPGHSISRQPADIDTDSANDWLDLSQPQPGIVHLTPPTPTESPTRSPTPVTETPTQKPPSPTSTTTPTPTLTEVPQPTFEIVINEILADPDSEFGDANNDGVVDYSDDEFVELINNSSIPMDISAWSIGDVLSIRHSFPAGTILEPGCGLILFGGGIPNGDFGNFVVQVASTGELSFNDIMETIYVYDSQQDIVASLGYGEESGDDQSITRDPDIVGTQPLKKHSLASGSNGAIFSPGTMIDGSIFSGCME